MSSGITLSAASRQNLLSLQDTASLLSTTQGRLSTGKKVNSALDNPVNFFTAQSLDSRASDLSGLLDNISNGIQTIQAANQGITNIQKLLDSAKSITTQALASKNYTGTTAVATAAAVPPTSATTQTISLTVDNVARNVTIPAGTGTSNAYTTTDVDAVVTALNTSAGVNIFSNDGGKIKLGASGATGTVSSDVRIATADAAKLGFAAAVAGTGEDSTRTSLANQYNSLLQQITQLSNDASYNGVNLLNNGNAANKLHVQFNSKDTSSLDISGTDSTASGLGLSAISGKFQSDTDVSTVVNALTTATNTLRARSSTFGSNLSVVQNRQDFSKNLINVLTTGSSNLTSADLNEEAANSQALSTRNSLAISALSLANQAQQGVLQLLR